MSAWGMVNQVRRWLSKPLVLDYRHQGHLTTSATVLVPMFFSDSQNAIGAFKIAHRRRKTAFIKFDNSSHGGVEVSFGYHRKNGESITGVSLFRSPPTVIVDFNTSGVVPIAYNVTEEGFRIAFLSQSGVQSFSPASPEFTIHVKGEKRDVFWWERLASIISITTFWVLVTASWWAPLINSEMRTYLFAFAATLILLLGLERTIGDHNLQK